MSNLVMETSPNIVLIVGPDMRILEYSDVGEKYFGKTRTEALEMYLYEFIDPVDFQWVFDTHQNIHGKRVSYPEYHLSTLQNIVYIEKENAVLATFIDITREEELAQEDYEKKLETIDLAQKVIHKQMMVAQEIAGLLGETTAETKTTLSKLCRSLLDDSSLHEEDEMEPPLENVHIGSGAVPLSGVMTRDSLGGGSPRQAGAQAVISGAPGIRPGASGASASKADSSETAEKPAGYVHLGSIRPKSPGFGR